MPITTVLPYYPNLMFMLDNLASKRLKLVEYKPNSTLIYPN